MDGDRVWNLGEGAGLEIKFGDRQHKGYSLNSELDKQIQERTQLPRGQRTEPGASGIARWGLWEGNQSTAGEARLREPEAENAPGGRSNRSGEMRSLSAMETLKYFS